MKPTKLDPLGIKNVCFSHADSMSKTDDRQKEWKNQRLTRGFDNTELWNLDKTIAKFILPRLVEFRKYNTNADISKQIDKMIIAFEILSTDEFLFDNKTQKKINDGLKSFSNYYSGLWN